MPDEVGNCICPCGQEYRFANGAEGLSLWPRCGVHAYRREPLAEPRCIRCGADLAERLEGIGAGAET